MVPAGCRPGCSAARADRPARSAPRPGSAARCRTASDWASMRVCEKRCEAASKARWALSRSFSSTPSSSRARFSSSTLVFCWASAARSSASRCPQHLGVGADAARDGAEGGVQLAAHLVQLGLGAWYCGWFGRSAGEVSANLPSAVPRLARMLWISGLLATSGEVSACRRCGANWLRPSGAWAITSWADRSFRRDRFDVDAVVVEADDAVFLLVFGQARLGRFQVVAQLLGLFVEIGRGLLHPARSSAGR
jgi:hypothetical protein